MDNHDDNQYKLLIDTVNNNRSDKTYSTSNLNAISQCSLYPLTLLPSNNSRLENHGSSRRKCATLFKGITIEEFLEADDDPYSLTAIDKLILKNKAALAEDQMKKARSGATSKSTKESAPSSQSAGGKKQSAATGTKKTVRKVLGSKIATKRKNPSDSKKAVAGDKCNGVSKTNGNVAPSKVKATTASNKDSKKTKTVSVLTVTPKKESRSRNGVEDVNGKEQNQPRAVQQTQQKPPAQQKPQQQRPQPPAQQRPQQPAQPRPQQPAQQRPQLAQPRPQQKSRQQTSASPRKQQRAPMQQQPGKKRMADGPRLTGRRDMRAKLKQNAKQSSTTMKKSRELGRLKTNLSYQTRSGNKERLRNGKSRIYHEEESSATPSKSTKRQKRCDEAPTPPPLLIGSVNLLKRIKQEPRDGVEQEVVCEKRRRLSEIKVEAINCAETQPVVKESAKETSEQTKAPIPCEPVPSPTPVVAEKPSPIKEEDENVIKEEFSDDFVEEDGADLIDINFITSLLASTDRVSSSFKGKPSSNVGLKSETVPTEMLGSTNTLQNGDISKNAAHVTSDPLRTPLMAPFNGPSERPCKPDVPNTNSFLSEVNNRLNNDNSIAKESMFNALGLQSTIAKESMFNALGLQSINKVYQMPKECEVKDKENYTGTLKAIIKVDKGCRRMEMKQRDAKSSSVEVR